MTASAPATAERTAYRIRALSVEACSCKHGCNCQFGGFPNEGICEFVIGYDVREGHFGDVDLAGARFVVVGKYPNAIHDGNGRIALFVDEKMPDEQVNALAVILTGQAGGMPWEALAATVTSLEGPIRRPIEISAEGQHAVVRIGGAVELETTPLLNPVTGAVNEVRITYPRGGFFWNEGNVVTTSAMHVDHGDMTMDWKEQYAAIAEVDWTNQV